MKYLLLLHLIVFIFGFTGILGKLIEMGGVGSELSRSVNLVVYRMVIAAIGILGYIIYRRRSFAIETRWLVSLVLVGGLIAAHWITFFLAIKVSNVSVTLACISSAALFTAFLEPLILKKKLDYTEVLMGLAIIGGIYIIFQAKLEYVDGILLSLLSAFLAALFAVLNAKFIRSKGSSLISFYELASGAILAMIFLGISDIGFISPAAISSEDWIYLIILGLVATAFAFVVSVFVMRSLSPFTVSLAINLEPIYAMILALIIFDDEQMNSSFYIGAGIIIGTLTLNGYIKRLRSRKTRKPDPPEPRLID